MKRRKFIIAAVASVAAPKMPDCSSKEVDTCVRWENPLEEPIYKGNEDGIFQWVNGGWMMLTLEEETYVFGERIFPREIKNRVVETNPNYT